MILFLIHKSNAVKQQFNHIKDYSILIDLEFLDEILKIDTFSFRFTTNKVYSSEKQISSCLGSFSKDVEFERPMLQNVDFKEMLLNRQITLLFITLHYNL